MVRFLSAAISAASSTIGPREVFTRDRKSTRLNSSHLVISYAVFCLKKKKKVFLGLQRSLTKMVRHLTDIRVEGARDTRMVSLLGSFHSRDRSCFNRFMRSLTLPCP